MALCAASSKSSAFLKARGNNSTGGDSEEEKSNESEHYNDYGSDVHAELRVVREDLREYNKTKKVKAPAKEKLDGFLSEDGLDEGYEDIDNERTNLRYNLGGEQVCDDGGGGGQLRAKQKKLRLQLRRNWMDFLVKMVKAPAKEKLDGFLSEDGLDEGYEDIDNERTNLRYNLGGEQVCDDGGGGGQLRAKQKKLRLQLRRNWMDFLVKMGEQVCDDGGGGGQLRARKKSSTVVYHPDCEKVIWQDLISAAEEVFPACEHRMCA
ncbi:hypothetical protein KY290_007902 [Solanum tuberosum]|uniref:Uncharacterized protein n=1 Tax=Solanum tuberosum TaxID=4113 RepID=A0ABQ7W872_SOLTU|nr:hypothetical protein KY290_007902 [Solanum tuberosum]